MDSTVQQLIQDMYASHGSVQRQQAGGQGADQRVVRGFNRLLVLNYVRENGPLPRVQLAQETGLSRTTVSNIIDTLLQEGFVREGDLLDAAPVGGRRAMLVHFNADAGRIMGLDVGRTHLAMILTDLQAEIIARTSGPFEMARGPEICLPLLINEVRAFVESASVPWSRIVGIGVGIPGPLDARQHTLSGPPGMPGWDGVDVWQALHQAFNVPLYLDNDANMGALSECRYGAGMGSDYLAYVKVGTGIGAGLIFNGRIFRGHGGSAGELGHMTIDENGSLCSCGNRGCLETLVSASALIQKAHEAVSLGITNHLLRLTSGNSQTMSIETIARAARDGDRFSLRLLSEAASQLAVAMAGTVNLLNPELIVLGGGLSAGAGDLLLPELERAVKQRVMIESAGQVQLQLSSLSETDWARGGALLIARRALEEMFFDFTQRDRRGSRKRKQDSGAN